MMDLIDHMIDLLDRFGMRIVLCILSFSVVYNFLREVYNGSL